ncbi:MAG: DUF1289 domain-containing protein [Pseudomonadales bacterium]
MASRRPTPCVGICSTTYGDLVCRGCKRYAHEIVQWNGYDEAQQQLVWQRLKSMRDEVLGQVVECFDQQRFQDYCQVAELSGSQSGDLLYSVVVHLVQNTQSLAAAGLGFAEAWRPAQLTTETDSLAVLQTLDAESFVRAQAHYERNFKVTV